MTVVVVALVLSGAPLFAQPATPGTRANEVVHGRPVAGGEVLVKFRGATADTHRQVRQQEDADVLEPVGRAGAHLLRSRSKDVPGLLRSLSARPDVEYVEPNFIVSATAATNDTYVGLLWGLQNTGQTILGSIGTAGADIDAVSAWGITTGSTAYVVGVVDTGIDYAHPDLAANVWSAPTTFTVTIGGQTITCAAGTHGFDAIRKTCDPLDDHNHGTHVAGTIGALGNNNLGVVGVNWTASIMGLKFLGANGSGTVANAINAIEFAVQARAWFGDLANVRVLSNSWGGGGFSQAMLDAITSANASNMLFVAAAGNDGANNDATPFYPASYDAPNIVSVAATDNKDALASFSNYGALGVNLGAPGVNIASTVRNSSYAWMSGTSMATPHVSGAAGLVLSACPQLDTAGLRSTIVTTVDQIGSLAGVTVTGGRLNVAQAIAACYTPPPVAGDFAVSATPASQAVTPGGTTTYTVGITPQGGFSAGVTLSVTGQLPPGVTATFAPTSISGSDTSTLTVATNAGTATPVGTYALTVSATGGGVTHSTTVNLVVRDFSLSVSPASKSITAGGSASYTVSVSSLNGFSGAVALSATGLPSGATVSFSPSSLPGAGSSTMTVTTATSTAAGTYTVTVTGTSGSLSHSRAVTLSVAACKGVGRCR